MVEAGGGCGWRRMVEMRGGSGWRRMVVEADGEGESFQAATTLKFRGSTAAPRSVHFIL